MIVAVVFEVSQHGFEYFPGLCYRRRSVFTGRFDHVTRVAGLDSPLPELRKVGEIPFDVPACREQIAQTIQIVRLWKRYLQKDQRGLDRLLGALLGVKARGSRDLIVVQDQLGNVEVVPRVAYPASQFF